MRAAASGLGLLAIACGGATVAVFPPAADEPRPCRDAAAICGASAALCGAVRDDCAGLVDCGPCDERATSPPSWRAGPTLPLAAETHAATIEGDATYLMIGASLFRLAGTELAFEPRAGRPYHLLGATMVAAGGRLFVAAGREAPTVLPATILAYVPEADRWAVASSTTPGGRTNAAACALADGTIAFSGGVTGLETARSVDLFDPKGGRWSTLPDLREPRDHHGLVELADGSLLAVGGRCCNDAPDVAEIAGGERLTRGAPRWEAARALNRARASPAAIVGADGRVYAIGGEDTASVEAWDADLDRWTPVAPLRARRSGSAAALLRDGRILVAGGIRDRAPTTTTELYGPSLGAPASALAGETIDVSGDNFAAGARVYFYLDEIARDGFLGRSTTDGAGVLAPTRLALPQAARGVRVLIAVDTRSRYPARREVLVLAPR